VGQAKATPSRRGRLLDSLYRKKHGLTVTGNYSMRDLVEHERMHPAIVRSLDDMCSVIEV